MALRRDLDVEDDWPWRYDTLSCDQQKRLQVACALWQRPDLLVMDEPTNHVDTPTREAITAALAPFKGVGLLISHDRALLDALCVQCLFMAEGRLTARPGGYSRGRDQEELERERPFVSANRRGARKNVSQGRPSAVGRRPRGRPACVAAATSTRRIIAGKSASSWPSTRERMAWPASSAPVWRTASLVPPLSIGNTDHIALTGPNGAGKTTLVSEVARRIDPTVRVLVIPPEPIAEQCRDALSRLSSLDPRSRGRVLAVGFLPLLFR